MPRRITFSTISYDSGYIRGNLDQFGKQNGMDVTLQELDYSTGWADFMRMTIYGGGPDVSEIGSTWVNDFAAMNVLRPFSESDLSRLGDVENFVPAQWRSSIYSGTLWSIPWLTDVRMVLYRRDMLAKAGVEENGAFETPERFEQTLQQLQDSGVPFPLTIQTLSLYMNVHNLAMWVWHAGENLVDVQKKMVLFDQPKVRSAILSYLQLHRFVSKTKQLQTGGANPSFDRGEAAVTIDGPWAFNYSPRLPEVNANLGVAIPLGCSYIGGSNLVIWQQSSEIPDDMNLIAHLTSREFFEAASPRRGGLLPGRLDSLEFYPLPDPSFLPLLEQALKTGRTLPNMDLWGLVEDRFGRSVSQLWEEIFTSPKPDLEALYDKYITSMVHRLNITLSPP